MKNGSELESLVRLSENYCPFVKEMQRLSKEWEWEAICEILLQCMAQVKETS